MISAYVPELLLEGTITVNADPATQAVVTALVRRLGEQRNSRMGDLEHTEFELVLVRLDRLGKALGFEDLYRPGIDGWRIWYSLPERRLDVLAYRPVPGGKEVLAIAETLR